MSVIELLEGPLWQASAGIFLVFVTWRLAAILVTGRSPAEAPAAGSPLAGALRMIFGHFLAWGSLLRQGRVQFVSLAGYAFHLGLFALLFFAAPHVVFLRDHVLGFDWPALPRWGFIIAAEITFAALIALWVRRFVDPVVRLISRPDDHIAAGLTFMVMLTGCMALGEQSVVLRAIHLGFAELWLVYFPFGSLMHAFSWPLSRGYTGAMAGRRGTRM